MFLCKTILRVTQLPPHTPVFFRDGIPGVAGTPVEPLFLKHSEKNGEGRRGRTA